MASAISNLPEELILRVFHSLGTLNDLWSVMLTSKQFNRISKDVKSWKITQLALETGSYFPALQPIDHVLLLASARRLSEWAREDETRQIRLKREIQGGIAGVVALASEVVPIGLQELREVAIWRRNILIPLSETLERNCGPTSKTPGEEYVSVCEAPYLALLAWAIYGELFDHMMSLERLDPKKKLDSVTRFRFLVYCVPDVNCFKNNKIDPPTWFGDLEGRRGERFQQLSLRRAMERDLSERKFAACLQRLIDFDLEKFHAEGEGGMTPDTCSAASLFLLIVINSGRRALEVLQLADMARNGRLTNPDNIISWLRDLWTRVDRACSSASGPGVPGLINTEDHWLERHFGCLRYDIDYTWQGLQGYIPNDLKQKDSMSGGDLLNALAAELQP